MKTKLFFLFAIVFLLITHISLNAQDTIIRKNGEKIICQIQNEDSSTVYFTLKINRKKIKTFLNKNKIQSIKHGVLPEKNCTFLIETIDGNEYIGNILYKDSLIVRFTTEKLDDITFTKKDIKKIIEISATEIKRKKYWFANPLSTRYFFSPNGYGLKKGEVYYQNILVLFNQLSFSITNNISLGCGLFPTILFGFAPIWITPKLSFPIVKGKFNLGTGVLIGTVIGSDESGLTSINKSRFGILYGISTFGSRNENLSIGLGYGFSNGRLAKTPTFELSGMIRVESWFYLLTENYYFNLGDDDTLFLLSIGGRWVTKKIGLDFGLIIPRTNYHIELKTIPWLGLTIPF